jgi:hydroxymethylglutaryl-CoA reductase (NADPH)
VRRLDDRTATGTVEAGRNEAEAQDAARANSRGARVREKIPRDRDDDYTPAAAAARRAFLHEHAGVTLDHVSRSSFDPTTLRGNVEHFIGVAQVPIGVAGPLLVNGEHARGEFYVPLATSEGTLVASYNRGMKMLHDAGGVTTTILDDSMQRAPAFVFESAREARAFGEWLREHLVEIKEAAEATTRSGRLRGIEQYSASRILFTRFDYTTGDAAGQNLTGKATAAACAWITANYAGITSFYLESNFATDKKSSQVNILRTRGKRVVAEATLPAALIKEHMHTTAERLFRARQVSNLGGFMSGVNNNGAHSANGIAALFIATGQDAANVAESSAALGFSELLSNGDYYASITIPSLIVATYGGGTGLATQRECLELLGCYGAGKVRKLAEIVAATVLCGELSLGSAIVAEEWVKAHDLLGRNRP